MNDMSKKRSFRGRGPKEVDCDSAEKLGGDGSVVCFIDPVHLGRLDEVYIHKATIS